MLVVGTTNGAMLVVGTRVASTNGRTTVAETNGLDGATTAVAAMPCKDARRRPPQRNPPHRSRGRKNLRPQSRTTPQDRRISRTPGRIPLHKYFSAMMEMCLDKSLSSLMNQSGLCLQMCLLHRSRGRKTIRPRSRAQVLQTQLILKHSTSDMFAASTGAPTTTISTI